MGLVAIPNERSSHSKPTPSGGGAASTIAAIGCGIVLAITVPAIWPILGIATALSLLGLMDDLVELRAIVRFPLQVLCVTGLVLALSPLPIVELPYSQVLGGVVLTTLVTIAGLWWINLFNFMDGIDGIAASQTIVILVSGVLLWLVNDADAAGSGAFWFAIVVAASAAGFLVRNWPPARIFMGDAGSYFFAIAIFAIALLSVSEGALNYASWIILVAPFVTDASVTLIRRLWRGERPWQAHRQHAYQQLSRRWGHRNVTLLYGLIGLAWALPLAGLATGLPQWQWMTAAAAYAPLVVFAFWANAGSANHE